MEAKHPIEQEKFVSLIIHETTIDPIETYDRNIQQFRGTMDMENLDSGNSNTLTKKVLSLLT